MKLIQHGHLSINQTLNNHCKINFLRMRIKPVRSGDLREIFYDEEHWRLLHDLRCIAIRVMEVLERSGLKTVLHGSLARGDVHAQSDIDILIPYPVPSYKVEIALDRLKVKPFARFIVQATPSHVIKAHIEVDEKITVTFPLVKLRKLEREFYRFGGEVTLEELRSDIRTPGISKKLLLIIPTSKGHLEVPIVGREAEAAKIVGVSVDIVKERVRVLMRRDEIGRTGIYLKYPLSPEESFEEAFKKIVERDPAVRRRLKL